MKNYLGNRIDKMKVKKIIVQYSCLFLCISAFIVFYLLLNGKTNINMNSDGMNQHYRAMLYYSSYLKQIVINLFSNHKLIMPHWNHAIGEGADIISTLHSDAVGDPLTFLSFLIPERYLPAYYMFNTFIRIYLAGLFFILLCLYLGKQNTYAIIAGSMVYDFCFWSLESITHHVYFLTPLMYLPLLILGVEKIINDDEPFTFVVAVMLGSISWLYFFYMEAAATAIYGIVRLLYRYRTDFKSIIRKLSIIIFNVVLGLGLGALVLSPMIYNYMNDSRMGIDNAVSLFYPPFFYERLLTIFVSNDSTYDLCLGFAAPALLMVALTIKNYRKNPCLFIFNVLCFVFLCIPVFGKIMNGFAFVSQRWSFVIALPVAYSVVDQWDEIRNNKKYLYIVLLFMFALTAYSAWSRNERVIVPMCFALIFLIIASSDMKKQILKYDLSQVIMIVLILFNIIYIEQYHLSQRGGNAMKNLLTIESAADLPYSSEAYIMKNYLKDKDDSFYRYTGSRLTNNAAMTHDVKSTSFYWSITNPSDQLFRLKLGLLDYISWQIHGYDNRAQLESLANVRYYIASDTYDSVLPYGFQLKDNIEGYSIYENRYFLPFGYTYRNAMPYTQWDSLDPVEKQQAMMEYVVVDDDVSEANVNLGIDDIKYDVVCSDGIDIDGNKIVVEKENAYLTLKFDGVAEKENYLLLSGLDYEDTFGVIEDDHSLSSIVASASNGRSIYMNYLTKSHHYYFGKSDYLAYFGYGEPLNEITLSFSLVGSYTFDKLSVIVEDLSSYQQQILNLSEDTMENVVLESNIVTGTVNLDEDKYLLLSIPYSAGWEAFVDGEQVKLLQANQHYMGLKLAKGYHNIQLRYHSPGLALGALISCVSAIMLAIYIYIYKKNNRLCKIKRG